MLQSNNTYLLTLLILLTRSLALLPTWPYQLELTISFAAVLQSPLSTAALMFWNLESIAGIIRG